MIRRLAHLPANLPHLSVLLPAALLLPFLGKAFHVDDTLFLLLARAVQERGAGAFAEPILWDSLYIPASRFPHALPWPALLAAVTGLAGEREAVLHLVTFGFGLLALHGIGLLAGRLGVSRLTAGLLFAGSSAFLALGSSVMPDLPMAGCAVAAIAHGVRGVEDDRRTDRWLAGLLAAAACLLRYNGALSIGLLVLYPLLARAVRLRFFTAPMLALGGLAGWEVVSAILAGHPHFLSTLGAWSQPLSPERLLGSVVSHLAHLGAQLPALGLPLAALAAGRKPARGFALILVPLALSALAYGLLGDGWALVFLLPAFALLTDAAARLATAAAARFRGDPATCLRTLLAVWAVLGTFATVSYVHVSAKYMLLPLPAAVLLLLDALARSRRLVPRLWTAGSVVVTLAVGLAVAWSDARWANGYRAFVAENAAALRAPGKTYLNADWGLRLYGGRTGCLPFHGQRLTRDDLYVSGSVASQTWGTELPAVTLVTSHELSYAGPFALHDPELGAGFYSSGAGRYPFVPSAAVKERIGIFRGVLPVDSARDPRRGETR